MMTMEELPDISGLSGAEKAAILLTKMGKEQAAKVLRMLRDNEVAAITAEIARMHNVPSEQVAAVMQEFRVMTSAQRYVAQGGVDFARELLEQSLGLDKAGEILDRLHVTLMDAPFEFLR